MLEFLRSMARPDAASSPPDLDAVLTPLREDMTALYVLHYLRMMCRHVHATERTPWCHCVVACSLELQAHEDDYLPYIMGIEPDCVTVKMFCDLRVDAVKSDADQVGQFPTSFIITYAANRRRYKSLRCRTL
jgi:hypothetical protein